jgi:cytochrome c peroxidase
MDAWTSDPTPAQFVKGRTPLELQGALVLQNKQCRTCHALDGVGGERGELVDLATSDRTYGVRSFALQHLVQRLHVRLLSIFWSNTGCWRRHVANAGGGTLQQSASCSDDFVPLP